MPDTISAPDLTKRPPRSARCRLGGYVILPRMLDKGRAEIAGTAGEFHYDCPLDQRIVNFIGFDAKLLRKELESGKGDGEILAWLAANGKNKREPWEIEQWSNWMDKRGPDSDKESLEFFGGAVDKIAPGREDIKGWMELLDLDDYVTFGGKP